MSMWPIIYRILYPMLTAAVGFSIWAFLDYRSYKSAKKRMEKHKDDKKHKMVEIALLFGVAFLGLYMAGYYSLDLIFQDFVTQTGIYDRLYYDHDVHKVFFDVNGESESVFALRSYTRELIEGEQYNFTYAKRTGMILNIDKIYN